MHMYGCELWNLSLAINKYIVAWRKIKRYGDTVYNLTIVHNLSNDVAFQLDKRIYVLFKLNHSNKYV